MECPFCKEEIKDTAVKCKHCGSNLTNRPLSENDAKGSPELPDNQDKKQGLSGLLGGLLKLSCGLGLLYMAGWGLMWGETRLSNDALWIQDNGFAVRLNEDYYGMRFEKRYFDSPIISWGLLFLVLGVEPILIFPSSGKASGES